MCTVHRVHFTVEKYCRLLSSDYLKMRQEAMRAFCVPHTLRVYLWYFRGLTVFNLSKKFIETKYLKMLFN